MSENSDKEYFQNRYYLIAQKRLRLLQKKYQYQFHKLTNAKFHNILSSIQWCHDNGQRQMVIDFTLPLQNFFDQQNHWREGVRCLGWALEAALYLNDENICSSLYFNLGLLYDRQSIRVDAEQNYQMSAELADKLKQTGMLANAKHRLGWIAHSRHKYELAKSLYNEAKSLRETLDPPDLLALSRSWHQLGILAQDMDDYKLAQTNYEKALKIREAHNDLYLAAISLHQLGALAVKKKEWESAKEYFEKALSIRRDLKDRAGEASVFDQLGFIAKQHKDWVTARDNYLNSLKLQEELGDVSEVIREKLHLGEVSLAQRDFEQAKKWFQNCLEESRKIEDAFYHGQSHLQLGMVFYYQSDLKKAVAHYQHGLKTFLNLDGTQPEQAGILYQLGLIAFEQGNFQTASQMFKESLTIREQKGLDFEAAMSRLQLGMAYYTQGMYEIARQHYETSLATFEKLKDYQTLAQVTYRLGILAEVLKQLKDANEYYSITEHLCKTHNLSPPKDLAAAFSRVMSNSINEWED